MESQNLIDYKWECGIYTLDYMMMLVQKGILTKEDFFEITRFNYDGVKKSKQYK